MIEKEKSPSGRSGGLTYEGKRRDAELTTLAMLLEGKPDTPKWREILAGAGGLLSLLSITVEFFLNGLY